MSILGGLSASPGLGYSPGAIVQAQIERPLAHVAAHYDSANKYIGDGYSYGASGHLRFGRQVFAGPGVSIGHTSTSRWDKTSLRPAAVLGLRRESIQAWAAAYVWDTGPNKVRGVGLTFQARADRIIVQSSIKWLSFDRGSGWSASILAGYRF